MLSQPDLTKLAPLSRRAATLLRPSTRHRPDVWARANRRYLPTDGRPGPRDPTFTPYVVEFTRASDVLYSLQRYGRRYSSVVLACGSQMGKTDAVLDIVGANMDQRPAPILYVGPTENFIQREIGPRLDRMLSESDVLRERLALGKRSTRYRKLVGGVPIALAWAGSAAQVAGMAAKIALVDELDRMSASIQGEGDPFSLVEARGFSYLERVRMAISTPLIGTVDTERDEASGLEFWREMEGDDVASPIWRLWQGGTRHHWACPCPDCGGYFIPRFKQLKIADEATAIEARRDARLICPRCEAEIENRHKREMNSRGVYVAPGQIITTEGEVVGEPPESTTLSFWVSGLMSPFVTFGDRAASFVEARRAQSEEKKQSVINTGFGECYAPGAGDVPEYHEVLALRSVIPRRALPEWTQHLTLCVDVQRRRLIWSIRAWGAQGRSHTVDHGEIHGWTYVDAPWEELAQLLTTPIDGRTIGRALIDSGFRPGKPENVPLNPVYRFCRRFRNRAYPSKGKATQDKPVIVRKSDLTARGDVHKFGLDLVWIDTHRVKSTVHEKIRFEAGSAGSWSLHADADADFAKQVVAEACTRTEGKPVWVARSKENHFLDVEAMHEALGLWARFDMLRERETGELASAGDGRAARLEHLRALGRRARAA